MRFPTRNRRVVRLYASGVVFGLFCLVYIIRLAALELNGNNIHGGIVRTEQPRAPSLYRRCAARYMTATARRW